MQPGAPGQAGSGLSVLPKSGPSLTKEKKKKKIKKYKKEKILLHFASPINNILIF